ncbi:CSRP2BP family protein [Megaselia abdita]
MVSNCGYCFEPIIEDEDDFMQCQECLKNVHVKCLKRKTPGDLKGDIFFKFTCSKCVNQDNDQEIFVRSKMLWALVIILAMYNLSIKSRGLSRLGYFHWRTHIVNYIDKNWEHIFGLNVRKKKTLVGTIAGCLSHNNPTIFTSGQEIFKEAGWWKLSQNEKPSFFQKLLQQDKKTGKKVEDDFQELSNLTSPREEMVSSKHGYMTFFREVDSGNQCSRTIPYIAKKSSAPMTPTKIENIEADNLNTVQSSLMDFLAENFSTDGLIFNDVMPPIYDTPFDIKSPTPNSKNQSEEENQPRIVQFTNYQKIDDGSGAVGTEQLLSIDYHKNISEKKDSEPEEDESPIVEPCKQSLFTKVSKRSYPWLEENSEENEQCSNMVQMSESQEEEFYYKLRRIVGLEDKLEITITPKIRRLYRKLSLRHYKLNHGKHIFDIDKFNSNIPSETVSNKKQHSMLDRYHLLSASNAQKKSLNAKIVGKLEIECIESPFTCRVLHPFIYRSSTLFPPWLKLMCELQLTVNNRPPTRASIDFCYVRPNHIMAVNTLLQSVFWPGIDISEALKYPDFSVVALYKKLVVGCAFLIPDVNYNEVYLSFMAVRPGWQRAGIATFMLYHLLQTNLTKDISLHVSASNTAVCLYQKFGFKIEEVILDFYEKYLPAANTQSRHAFLLKMQGANII